MLTNTSTYEQVCNHPFLFGEPKDEFGTYVTENNKRSLVSITSYYRLNNVSISVILCVSFQIYASLSMRTSILHFSLILLSTISLSYINLAYSFYACLDNGLWQVQVVRSTAAAPAERGPQSAYILPDDTAA